MFYLLFMGVGLFLGVFVGAMMSRLGIFDGVAVLKQWFGNK